MGALVLRKSIATGLIAACVLFAVPASTLAADLGGDCCADLEERIAELEATTARKGNRKVSLTVSGWVTQQVMFWDDGEERNVYVHDLGTTLGSHFKFSGQANFAPGWDAGYTLHIEAMSSNGLTHSQERDNGPGRMNIQQSYWFLKSDALGKVSLGRQSQASDNAAILADGSGSHIQANWVAFDVASFRLRRADNGEFSNTLTWGAVGNCKGMGGAWGDCNGLPRNVVRYDSPTFGGFSVSASWGEDDMWDVAGRYAGTWGDFKVAAAVAYNEATDEDMIGTPFVFGPDKLKYLQAGAYIENLPTGLFAFGAYGRLDSEIPNLFPVGRTFQLPDAETLYVKGGLRQRWSSLGATVLYSEFLRNSDSAGFSSSIAGPGFSTTLDVYSSLDVWGLGVVQEIDSAAMALWIKYRRMSFGFDAKLNGAAETGLVEYQDFQYIGAGAIIHF